MCLLSASKRRHPSLHQRCFQDDFFVVVGSSPLLVLQSATWASSLIMGRNGLIACTESRVLRRVYPN
eukprot:jgi/Botrbrau1/12133/Bobra.0186s0049.1